MPDSTNPSAEADKPACSLWSDATASRSTSPAGGAPGDLKQTLKEQSPESAKFLSGR
jgi:hypothetical protein